MPRIGLSRILGASTGAASAGWFGDGSDGDLTVAAGQTLALEVAEDEGQIVKKYGNVNIEAGAMLKPANRCNGMILLVNGDLTVNGTISVDKCAPLLNSNEEMCLNEAHIKLCGALVGGSGGKGGTAYASRGYYSAAGGIGGNGHLLGGGYGGGGGAFYYWTSTVKYPYIGGASEPRPPHGILWPYPAPKGGSGTSDGNGAYGSGASASNSDGLGGSAPGGGGAVVDGNSTSSTIRGNGSAGDAYGGGALWIFVKGNVVIGSAGVLSANGGNGGAGGNVTASTAFYASGGSGGGGGGGIIALVYGGEITNGGSIRANGGTAGQGYVNTMNSFDSSGDDGSVGTVLIKTLSELTAA
jgi:hypothetical protein